MVACHHDPLSQHFQSKSICFGAQLHKGTTETILFDSAIAW